MSQNIVITISEAVNVVGNTPQGIKQPYLAFTTSYGKTFESGRATQILEGGSKLVWNSQALVTDYDDEPLSVQLLDKSASTPLVGIFTISNFEETTFKVMNGEDVKAEMSLTFEFREGNVDELKEKIQQDNEQGQQQEIEGDEQVVGNQGDNDEGPQTQEIEEEKEEAGPKGGDDIEVQTNQEIEEGNGTNQEIDEDDHAGKVGNLISKTLVGNQGQQVNQEDESAGVEIEESNDQPPMSQLQSQMNHNAKVGEQAPEQDELTQNLGKVMEGVRTQGQGDFSTDMFGAGAGSFGNNPFNAELGNNTGELNSFKQSDYDPSNDKK